MKATIEASLAEAREVLEDFLSQEGSIDSVVSGANILIETLKDGKKILSCGNGGSLTDAMHFAEELTGRFRENRKALPAISISDPSHLSCVGNDFGFDEIFSRYIEGVGQEGDALLVISTSGNSMNLIKAVEAARRKKMRVVALTGKTGGLLAAMVDAEIRVKGKKYADRIQEMHIKIIHILVQLIEEAVQ